MKTLAQMTIQSPAPVPTFRHSAPGVADIWMLHMLKLRNIVTAPRALSPTPSTTTRIARVCQDSGVAPITESLPRFLWPHDVMMWVRSSTQGRVQRRVPYRDTTDEGRSTPKNDKSLLREISRPAPCDEQMHHDNDGDEPTDVNHEPTKAHNARQRAERQAHSDGLRQ